GLQNLALAGIGTEDRGSIGARLEHFVVLLLALDVFARVVGAKRPAIGSRPPLDRTTEELFAADLQQRIRSTGAVFLFPLPVKFVSGEILSKTLLLPRLAGGFSPESRKYSSGWGARCCISSIRK